MDSVIEKLTNKLDRSNMIWKFIDLVINNKLELRKRKLDDVINQLESLNFIKIDNSYNYLLNIPAISFTKEKSDFYKNMWLDCKNQLSEYKKLTPQSIWLSELSLLRKELVKG
jgi:DNA topoisomerase-2